MLFLLLRYARHGDMYVVAVSRLNANAVLVFQYIYKLIQLFRTYFRGRFNEANVRQHFVLVYELLDGMLAANVIDRWSLVTNFCRCHGQLLLSISPADVKITCFCWIH